MDELKRCRQAGFSRRTGPCEGGLAHTILRRCYGLADSIAQGVHNDIISKTISPHSAVTQEVCKAARDFQLNREVVVWSSSAGPAQARPAHEAAAARTVETRRARASREYQRHVLPNGLTSCFAKPPSANWVAVAPHWLLLVPEEAHILVGGRWTRGHRPPGPNRRGDRALALSRASFFGSRPRFCR